MEEDDTFVIEVEVYTKDDASLLQRIFCDGLWANKKVKPDSRMIQCALWNMKFWILGKGRVRMMHIGQGADAYVDLEEVFPP